LLIALLAKLNTTNASKATDEMISFL